MGFPAFRPRATSPSVQQVVPRSPSRSRTCWTASRPKPWSCLTRLTQTTTASWTGGRGPQATFGSTWPKHKLASFVLCTSLGTSLGGFNPTQLRTLEFMLAAVCLLGVLAEGAMQDGGACMLFECYIMLSWGGCLTLPSQDAIRRCHHNCVCCGAYLKLSWTMLRVLPVCPSPTAAGRSFWTP